MTSFERLMVMVAAAHKHLEYRTSESESDDDYDERDGDDSSYEIQVASDRWTVIYYYADGQAGVCICASERPDDDPVTVAIEACDRARRCAKEASPW